VCRYLAGSRATLPAGHPQSGVAEAEGAEQVVGQVILQRPAGHSSDQDSEDAEGVVVAPALARLEGQGQCRQPGEPLVGPEPHGVDASFDFAVSHRAGGHDLELRCAEARDDTGDGAARDVPLEQVLQRTGHSSTSPATHSVVSARLVVETRERLSPDGDDRFSHRPTSSISTPSGRSGGAWRRHAASCSQYQHVLVTGAGAGGDQRLEGRRQPPPTTQRPRLPGPAVYAAARTHP
jgi:hypothetical protein